MLQYLRIKNYALIHEVALDWNAGFTVITGETGAGKSILLGALRFLCGNKADKNVINPKGDEAWVEAAISIKNTKTTNTLLDSLGLPELENATLLLKRTIGKKGSRIWVNGSLATQAALKKLADLWVDFHDPSSPRSLFQKSFQLAWIDQLCKPQLKAYQSEYHIYRALKEDIDELKQTKKLSRDQRTFYEQELNVLNQLNLTADDLAELENTFQNLDNSETLQALSDSLSQNLGYHALEKLRAALKDAQELASLDSSSEDLLERLNSILAETEDLSQEFAKRSMSLELSPEEQANIRDKMNLFWELERKYGDLDRIVQRKADLEKMLRSQDDVHAKLYELDYQLKDSEEKLSKLASTVNQTRQKSFPKLTKAILKELKPLGFPNANFEISLSSTKQYTLQGNAEAEFLFAPNPGHAAQPLEKIASSGETARVFLALKSITAASEDTPLLIFDEVDANIGGEVATQVGKLLKLLGKSHQLLSITHQPQVASQADHHLRVLKIQTEVETSLDIHELVSDDQKLDELSRMLGDRSSDHAKRHAATLMAAAN